MKPLEQAYIPKSETDRHAREYLALWIAGDKTVRTMFNASDATLAEQMIVAHMNHMRNELVFINDVYQVNVREVEGCDMVHLSIHRRDRQCCHDWRDLQEIKNQLLGPECEAVEIYPAESRRIDTANQYHLWGTRNDKFRFPVGWNGGRIVTDTPLGKSVNRPLSPV